MIKTAVVASLLAQSYGQPLRGRKERSDDSNETGARKSAPNPATGTSTGSTLNLAARGSIMGVSALHLRGSLAFAFSVIYFASVMFSF